MSKTDNNSVILGDCLEVMKTIEPKSIDMILSDLPYGLTSNRWDSIIPLDSLWNLFRHILKDNGVVALTASQPFSSILVTSNIEEFRHEWIWIKTRGSNFANTVREPMKEHESVLIFSKGKWVYNKQLQPRNGSGLKRSKQKFKWNPNSVNYRKMLKSEAESIPELRVPTSYQLFNNDFSRLHPTIKPVSLFEYLIKTYTNEGDLVLDCCAGSGTTAIACMNTNRNYICIEKDQGYFKIMQDRISQSSKPLEAFQ